ncbi:MAG: hypothetical protein ACT4OX_06780 [Actinomycetota bacterium]
MSALRDFEIPWFATVCREQLEPRFATRGFVELPAASETTIAFARDEVTVRLSYWPEDAPRYLLMVGPAILERGVGGSVVGIKGTHLSAVVPELERIASRPFSTPQELAEQCNRVADAIFDVQVWDRLIDRDAIQAAVDAFIEEQVAERDATETKALLARARTAFARSDWREAIDAYVIAGPEELQASDQKRLEIARSRLDDR